MENNDKMLIDATSREKIVSDTAHNYFVEAGAGSGKTTMLVRRMVAMVEAGVDVSKICAITFTKAAAGEFYKRFQNLLAIRSNAPTEADYVPEPGKLGNPTDISRERCLKALQNIDLCFMGTIDSFCNMVLSEHPTRANIPSNSMVKSEDEITDIYIREYTKLQNGFYGDELKKKCDIFTELQGYRAKDAFRYGIGTIMNIRHTDIARPVLSEKTFAEQFKEQREKVLEIAKAYDGIDVEAAKYAETTETQNAWGDLRNILSILRDEWEIPSTVTSKLKAFNNLRFQVEWVDRNPVFLAKYGDYFELAKYRGAIYYKLKKDTVEPLIEEIENYKAAKSIDFLIPAADKIAEVCQKNGELTFFDYLLYLRDMLKEDAAYDGKLIKHIYKRHSYFLIDEFQDTNPMQAEVFFYLTAEKPQTDWRQCVPRPGSLFIVGDPKQSIYRFRSADVSAFLRVKALFTEPVGEAIMLTRNFRSTYRLRNWFNKRFVALLPEETEEQSAFADIPLEEAPMADGNVNGVFYYESQSEKDTPTEERDPGKILEIISRLVNNPAYTLPEKNETKRKIDYKDFMIITPSKTSLGNIMNILLENSIPFYVEGETVFSECPALQEISSLFACIANPKDMQQLYKALATKSLGRCTENLGKIRDEGLSVSIFAEMDELEKQYPKEAAALKKLNQNVKDSYGMSSAALFKYILEEYRIFSTRGCENLEYIWFALELIRSEEKAGNITSLSEGAAFLKDLLDDQHGLERCISLKTDNNRIHIANLHKVKGLEAPIVILATPSSKSHSPALRVEQAAEGPKSWIFNISKPWTKTDKIPTVYLKSEEFEDQIQAEKNSADQEKVRLLYVAATRAKNLLLIACGLTSTGKRSSSNPWVRLIEETDGEFFEHFTEPSAEKKKAETVAIDDLYNQAPAEYLLQKESIKKKSYAVKRPSNLKATKAKSSENEIEPSIEEVAEEEQKKKSHGRRDGALIGTMTHKVMEVLVSSRNKVDIEALADEVVKEYATVDFTPSQDQLAVYKLMLINAAETMRSGGYPQTNGAPQDILAEMLSADKAYCEVPFCYEEVVDGQKVIWNGVIDAVYCKNGEWHIIDYKTNAETEGLDEHYESQMAAYEKAFEKMTGEKAEARIYHIAI